MVKEMKSITADAVPDALTTQLAQQPWRRCERRPKQCISWVLVHLTPRWTALCKVLLYLRTAVGNLPLDCWAVPPPLASDTLCFWHWCLRRSPAAASPRPCSLFLLLRVRANPRICLSARLHLRAGRQQVQSQTLMRKSGASLWLFPKAQADWYGLDTFDQRAVGCFCCTVLKLHTDYVSETNHNLLMLFHRFSEMHFYVILVSWKCLPTNGQFVPNDSVLVNVAKKERYSVHH